MYPYSIAVLIGVLVPRSLAGCLCVEGGTCQIPYGRHTLDILFFGVLPHCKDISKVRCCDRSGISAYFVAQEEDLFEPRLGLKVDQAKECGCIPKGVCQPLNSVPDASCGESFEKCCIPRNKLIQLSNQDKVFHTETQAQRPSPVYSPVPFIGMQSGPSYPRIQEFAYPSMTTESFLRASTRGYELPSRTYASLAMSGLSNPLQKHYGPFTKENPRIENFNEQEFFDYVLSCVPTQECKVIFSDEGNYWSKLGIKQDCPQRNHIRCVETTPASGRVNKEDIQEILEKFGIVPQPPGMVFQPDGTLIIHGGSPIIVADALDPTSMEPLILYNEDVPPDQLEFFNHVDESGFFVPNIARIKEILGNVTQFRIAKHPPTVVPGYIQELRDPPRDFETNQDLVARVPPMLSPNDEHQAKLIQEPLGSVEFDFKDGSRIPKGDDFYDTLFRDLF